jgi:pyrroline-5-carboxylate reductase
MSGNDINNGDIKIGVLKIGFVGAGRMATAMARSFVQERLVEKHHVSFFDPNADSASRFQAEIEGSDQRSSNGDVVKNADVVFLAVKPQYFADVAREICGRIPDDVLLVSIMAGINLHQLRLQLDHGRLIRVMPNTPCLIGQGASAFCAGVDAEEKDRKLIGKLLFATGLAREVPEAWMNGVTGVSGSGPAFVFTFVEALIDGAVEMGIARDVARDLAVQTVLGSAELVRQSGEHPALLRDQVTSPGGTTMAGMSALERNAFRSTVMAAVKAATLRAEELGG